MSNIKNEIKNYWNRRPCNINHSDKSQDNKEYFDEVEKRRYFVEDHIPDFAKFENYAGRKVLEIGCGIGTDSKKFAENKADLTCVDMSQNSIEIAKKRIGLYNLSAKFYVGDSEQLSSFLPEQKFDLIYSFGVIHHTPHPEKVLEECKKYMHENTEIKIMVYNKYSWKNLCFFIKNGYKFGFCFHKTSKYFAEAQLNCPMVFYYTKKNVEILFKDFHIKSIEKKFIFPYSVKDYINKKYNKIWIWKLLDQKRLEWLIGQHWLITAKLKK